MFLKSNYLLVSVLAALTSSPSAVVLSPDVTEGHVLSACHVLNVGFALWDDR